MHRATVLEGDRLRRPRLTRAGNPLVIALTVLLSFAPLGAQTIYEHKGFALGQALLIHTEAVSPEDAKQLMDQAVAAVSQVEVELAVEGFGWVARLNAATGLGPEMLEPEAFAVLQKALGFCYWSEGAFGPLGGSVFSQWGVRGLPAQALPQPAALQQAVAAASCNRLVLDEQASTAALGLGSSLDLHQLAGGVALDRAAATLMNLGTSNARLQIGRTQRAFGPGPHGRGWPVELPVEGTGSDIAEHLLLLDQSLSVVLTADGHFLVAGEEAGPYIDLSTGQPAGQGIVAVYVVSERAIDAQGLAYAMVILGNRQGQLRLGGLKPPPSVRWLLGSGNAIPVLADHHWARVKRP